MGIGFVNGTSLANTGATTGYSVTYAPTNGNLVWVALELAATPGATVSVRDNNSVSLTPLTNVNNTNYLYLFYYRAGSGVTSFISSWAGGSNREASTTIMEYAVSAGTSAVSATNFTTSIGTSSRPTISLVTDDANDYVIAAFGSGSGTTITSFISGTFRESTSTGTARLASGDNTATTASNVTVGAGQSVGITWTAVAGEIRFFPANTPEEDYPPRLFSVLPESLITVWQ